jgi:uncharacterized membrane protein YtjA (UPF0391 family)
LDLVGRSAREFFGLLGRVGGDVLPLVHDFRSGAASLVHGLLHGIKSRSFGVLRMARSLLYPRGLTHHHSKSKEYIMLTWTLIFLVISLIAGALGFSGISGAAATVARVLFLVFLIALVVAIILGIVHGFTWRLW